MASDSSSPRRSRSSSVEAAGNFGARPKPPNAGSNVRAIPRAGFSEDRRGQRLGRGRRLGDATERLVDAECLALDVASALAPRLRHRAEHVAKAGDSVPCLRREVGAGIERLALRSHEHRRRPAAASGHAHRRLHRDRVDVGPLLTVDLDVDEEVVHERGGGAVLERLVRHHVAPVARAVADRDEERLVLVARPFERLVSPLVPVDRVLGVLQEVRARRPGKTVHPASLPAET